MRFSKIALYGSGVLGSTAAQLLSSHQSTLCLTVYCPTHSDRDYFASLGLKASVCEGYVDTDFDIVLSCNWPRIFPSDFCIRYAGRCFNLHASHNLRFRGRYPNIFAIRSQRILGIKSHGVCIHRIRPQLDSGEIVLYEEYPIDNVVTSEDLDFKNRRVASSLLSRFVDHLSHQIPFSEVQPAKDFLTYRECDLGPRVLSGFDREDAFDFVRSLDHSHHERAYLIDGSLKRYLSVTPLRGCSVAHVCSDSRVIFFVN